MKVSLKNSLTHLYPSKKILKRMGMFKDQDGIMQRYLHERMNWNEHFKCTREFIIESLTGSGATTVSILGSGWMLDLPQSYLSNNFEHVIFYDIRHPRPIKHRYRSQRNFQFIEIDLTGGILEKVYRMASQKTRIDFTSLVSELDIPSYKLPFETDYILSVNILNQLDILIVDYLKTKLEFPDPILYKLRKIIQQNHLKLLHPGKSTLITDFEEISIDQRGNQIDIKPLIFAQIPEHRAKKTWTWKFDTRMSYHSHCNTYFNVMAVNL